MNLGRDIEHGGYPTSETRTIGQMRRDADAYAGIGQRAKRAVRTETQKKVDVRNVNVVGSSQSNDATMETNVARSSQMTLTLKSISKTGKIAYYGGAAAVISIPLGAFVDRKAPTIIEAVGEGSDFAGPRTAKPKLTAEERKAARAARPKPTLAERAAKAKERADKLAADLAKAEAPSQPEL